MYRLGVDIGGTKIHVGIFDGEEKRLFSHRKIYISDAADLPWAIKAAAEEICTDSGISFGDVSFCGVGIPGTVSADGRTVVKAPNISALGNNFASALENELKTPVKLVQDSRAAAWGEYLCGGAKGAKLAVCVTLGTGIGTGIVMNGEIFSGALGCAGELGHLLAVEGGRSCGCEKKGCLEKYCAGGGLDITAKELLGENKTAVDLFREACCGNESAKAEIEKAVSMLGSGLVSIVNLLSPDCLLFSGGLSEQEEMYLNPLMDYIRSHCYTAGELPLIKKAELSELAPMFGAAFIG